MICINEVINNDDYQNDIKAFYDMYSRKIYEEQVKMLKEVSGGKLSDSKMSLLLIPFIEKNVALIRMNDNRIENDEIIESGYDNIKEIFSAFITCPAIEKMERESDELPTDWNIKKLQIYYDEMLPRYPRIYRLGSLSSAPRLSEERKKISSGIKNLIFNNDNNHEIFVSRWVQYSYFAVFIITEIDIEYYRNYKKYSDTKEDETEYKYFLDVLIENFHEKWLEYIYCGLDCTTIDYIANEQSVIKGSANDMFGSRDLPEENIFTQISNYKNEGLICKGKIVFIESQNNLSTKFKNPVPLESSNIRKIRKLMELTNEDVCLVALIRTHEIIGLGNLTSFNNTLMIEFFDKNSWVLKKENTEIVKYIDSLYRVPEDIINNDSLSDIMKSKFSNNYDSEILEIIIPVIIHQKHGTILIITLEAEKETRDLINNKKGIGIEQLNLVKAAPELILGMSSIDGAIMIDSFGNCWGIGLILPNSSASDTQGNNERGARYNSALGYVNSHPNSIAIVISEDGMVDIISK